MQKLTNKHLAEAMAYLSAEPEFNLFFIGDIEQYGMESESVACYTSDTWHSGTAFPYFILIFRQNNILLYSHTADFNKEETSDFIKQLHPVNISGKEKLISLLLPYMPEKEAHINYLSRLSQTPPVRDIAPYTVKKLVQEDIPAIYELYLQIDEFAYSYRDISKEEACEDILENVSVHGRSYGIYEGGILISIAQTAAENSISAMVIGVATLPGFRGRGYAKAVVSALCADTLKEGRQFLCLFYSNPSAGRIYRSIGFQELGPYTMLRNK